MLKKIKEIGIVIIIISAFACCDSEKPIGLWDDNIKLSQKKVQFSSEKNSIVINTKGKWWWIHEVSLNGNSNFDLNKIDTNANNFIIKETEFKIERKNTTEIHIEMTKNKTNYERILFIGLEAGNYFDGIKITQAKN
ncbi:hypothetical protein [Tenacibaculum piscium]|uniref:Lipoprotein n=1 Tax=Tenacibaculum piscium TaxID=1458515 RepID=A0A2H1YIR0_9FLAO|nr:hypothetical protein [Tenacibaculum piscium]MBE7628599.1 hypothetical protein [Tenacibaculum piscium]MBE7669740.1 hypothetical protein [Tenacibaculum piscium]MBE7684672.1 hypothetical protein [Tenacibaculum piscium]MBE7689292.1 hypothetical protein [Tenacibaculum piscium]SOS75389.1 conserved hypothetical protein [Tenacibaculum piscium]